MVFMVAFLDQVGSGDDVFNSQSTVENYGVLVEARRQISLV